MYLNVRIVGKELKNKVITDLGFSLQKVEFNMQEIWQQTTPKIHTSKKTYKRKNKHKNKLD